MGKNLNLKAMYEHLRCGRTVNVNGCKIYRRRSRRGDRDYFFWERFGSSANKVTMQDLRWICKVIAKSTDYSYTLIS